MIASYKPQRVTPGRASVSGPHPHRSCKQVLNQVPPPHINPCTSLECAQVGADLTTHHPKLTAQVLFAYKYELKKTHALLEETGQIIGFNAVNCDGYIATDERGQPHCLTSYRSM